MYIRYHWGVYTLLCCLLIQFASGASVLMITMGGTKSHKIPFLSLGNGLKVRRHNVTLVSAFPDNTKKQIPGQLGVEEVAPSNFVRYVKAFTDWDILGPKLRGEEPVPAIDAFRYGYQACDAFLSDPETRRVMKRKFDLLVLDGAYPECALGVAYHYQRGVPFMYLDTVAYYTQSLSTAGNPALYSVTPYFGLPHSDSMTLIERTRNAFWHVALGVSHYVMVKLFLEPTLKRHLGSNIEAPYALSRNVSFILHNGHATLTYPRPFLPNVAEVGCMHCTPAKPLYQELEHFVRNGLGNGFIYVSMGSSVKASKMPLSLRNLLLTVFARLPYQIVWKYEDDLRNDSHIPQNVYIGKWLPQQDLLGHEKIAGFVNHGGLLSISESVYHGVPFVALPVFCDQESNTAKAVRDGYAIRLQLHHISTEALLKALRRITTEKKFKEAAKKWSTYLRDQMRPPLEQAIYWTEYVLRHNGAAHLRTPATELSFVQYFSIDVLTIYILLLLIIITMLRIVLKVIFTNNVNIYFNIKSNKVKKQ